MSSADHLAAVAARSRGCDPGEDHAHRREVELELLVARYYDRLVSFFRRRSNCSEDAVDLAQDTFERLSATDIGQIRKPASFLFTTALNLLRDRARSAQARYAAVTVPADEAQLICPAPQAERVLDGEQRMRVVEEELRALSPKCRAVFVLFHFDGMSHREIADQLRISVSMVEKYVKQAVRRCERRLDDLNLPQGPPGREAANNGGCAP